MNAVCSGKAAPQSASSLQPPERAAFEFLRSLKAGTRVLVAYSGGSDSTGLLALLHEQVKQDPLSSISLFSATVDHQLRPGSRDEALAAGILSERLGVRHDILTWAGPKPATGIQAAARKARYDLLDGHASDIGADLIVTAHSLDDQLETFAMRAARGSVPKSGISQAVLVNRRIWVARPLLNVRRNDIRAFLRARTIGWSDDPSNDNPAFERVRVRKAIAESEIIVDFNLLSLARRRVAADAAAFVEHCVDVLPGNAVMLDLVNFSVQEPGHMLALQHLIAFAGGRTHVAGRQAMQAIAAFVNEGKVRMTVERTVLDRRKNWLYIAREGRGLEDMQIPAGSSAVWDNRFRIDNKGRADIRIGATGHGHHGVSLIDAGLPTNLPSSVRKRISAGLPVCLEAGIGAAVITPVIAQFDGFLPSDLLSIAAALAFRSGLDHFPPIPQDEGVI